MLCSAQIIPNLKAYLTLFITYINLLVDETTWTYMLLYLDCYIFFFYLNYNNRPCFSAIFREGTWGDVQDNLGKQRAVKIWNTQNLYIIYPIYRKLLNKDSTLILVYIALCIISNEIHVFVGGNVNNESMILFIIKTCYIFIETWITIS